MDLPLYLQSLSSSCHVFMSCYQKIGVFNSKNIVEVDSEFHQKHLKYRIGTGKLGAESIFDTPNPGRGSGQLQTHEVRGEILVMPKSHFRGTHSCHCHVALVDEHPIPLRVPCPTWRG